VNTCRDSGRIPEALALNKPAFGCVSVDIVCRFNCE
jgi:hypothetical protein